MSDSVCLSCSSVVCLVVLMGRIMLTSIPAVCWTCLPGFVGMNGVMETHMCFLRAMLDRKHASLLHVSCPCIPNQW